MTAARRARGTGTVQLGSGTIPDAPYRALEPSGAPRGPAASNIAPMLARLTERQFQAIVVAGLKQRGYIVWTVPDMRKTTRGLPDLIAVHPTRVPRRVLFWELKTQTGRVRPEQRVALAALGDVYGVDARVIRPSDWLTESEAL